MSDVDWQAIRAEYESGASLRQLAARYDVSKTTLIRKRNSDGWTTDRTSGPRTGPSKKIVPFPSPSMPPNAITIASDLLADLANRVQGKESHLTYEQHVKASRALSEYVRVLITAPREMETQERLGIPLDTISPRTRFAIQQLLAEDEQENVG